MTDYFQLLDNQVFSQIIENIPFEFEQFENFLQIQFVNWSFFEILSNSNFYPYCYFSKAPLEDYNYVPGTELGDRIVAYFRDDNPFDKMVAYCKWQAKRKNESFFLNLIRNNSKWLDFIISSFIFYKNFMVHLKQQDNFEIFSIIVDNFKIPRYGTSYVIYRPEKSKKCSQNRYRYIRKVILHNFRHSYKVETSECTACRRSPVQHRAWTIRLLIERDDAELFELYLKQKTKYRDGSLQHYTLYSSDLVNIFIQEKQAIAKVLKESERTVEFSRQDLQKILLESSSNGIELALDFGLSLVTVANLRALLKRESFESALFLMNRPFEWKLNRQNEKHFRWRISKWPEEFKNRIISEFWRDLAFAKINSDYQE